ncbi:MAG: phenylalanine--tRNA ligase subunit beta [Candidatus Anstonellales archaeon]
MAVIPLPITYAEEKTKKSIEEIKQVLNKLGFPNEERDNYLDVEVTPNRLDMHTIEGIIRTLNSYFYSRAYEYKAKKGPVIYIKNVVQRPYINGFIAKLVKDKEFLLESLINAQEKIHDTYGRKRKKLAIGIHDLKKIKPPIYYQELNEAMFIPLGHEKEMHAEEVINKHEKGKMYGHLIKRPWPFVMDKEGVISMPPIINSERTKISEKTDSFLVEITGNDENAIINCFNVLACAFADRGAEIKSFVINNSINRMERQHIDIEVNEVNKIIGIELNKEDIRGLLERSNIIMKGKKCYVPCYRIDIKDITDIAEEIIINYGYENLEPLNANIYQTGELEKSMQNERAIFLNMGFNEVIGFFLIPSDLQSKFYKNCIKVLEPVSKEHDSLRATLLFNLFFVEERNKMKKLEHKIFEIGKVYRDNKEIDEIAFMIADEEADINRAIAVIKTFAKKLGLNIVKIENKNNWLETLFIKGRFAWFKLGSYAAIVGEISPEINEMLNINNPLTAGIIFNE